MSDILLLLYWSWLCFFTLGLWMATWIWYWFGYGNKIAKAAYHRWRSST